MEERAHRLSALHRAWRLLPTEPRRAIVRQATARFAPKPDWPPPPPTPGLAVAGEFDRHSGLGEAARIVVSACRALRIPVVEVRSRGESIPPGMPLLLVGNAPFASIQALRLGRAALRGRLVIGYWFWDLPTLPQHWAVGRAFVHQVWAPSRFVAAALATLFPVARTVILPVAATPLPRPRPDRAGFGLPNDALITLVIFSLASSFERKAPLAAIAAHAMAFGDRPDRILFLHVTDIHHFPSDFARLRAAADRPNIRLHTTDLDRAGVQSLLASADILLSLHRSEGFGLVPAEAMRLGLCVVATAWSATAEFMDPGSAALVPARLIPANDPRRVFAAPGAMWADPDPAAAADWLRRLAADPALRARLGKAAAAKIAACLGPQSLREALEAIAA